MLLSGVHSRGKYWRTYIPPLGDTVLAEDRNE
jgi:hypothetical protein